MRPQLRTFLIGGSLLGAGLLAISIFAMPQLLANRLADRVKDRYGLEMVVNGGAWLGLSDGPTVVLQDVTISDPASSGVPLARISQITTPASLAALLGADGPRHIHLQDPVISIEAARSLPEAGGTTTPPKKHKAPRPLIVAVNNGALTALDPAHDLTIAVTDISGEVSQAEAGTLEANLRGLLNGVSTRLQLSVDDVARLREKGSPADITLEGADSEVILSGRLGLADQLTFDGAISAQSPDVRKFLGWFGLNITGFEVPTPLGFDSGVSLSQSRGVFTNMALALGNQQAKGMMDIQAAAPRPRLKADLAFNMLDLNLYRGKASAKDQPTSPPDLNQVWSEAPRTLADLKALDADVTLTTDALKVGALQAGATTLKATLQEGALAAQLDTQAIAGGTATLNLGLAAADNPDLKLVLKAQNVESREFLGNAFGLTFLEGPVSLDVDVNAKGQSTAQWISTLAGTASVTAQDVSVNGLEVARLAGLLTKGDAEGWGLAPDSATLFAKANASAAIADGITTLQETKLQSEGFGLALEGTVDLLRQAVDLTAKPSAGNTLKLPVSARIKGPWRKPKMSTRLDAGTLLEGDLRDSDVEDIAKAAGKQAKKALKKILGD